MNLFLVQVIVGAMIQLPQSPGMYEEILKRPNAGFVRYTLSLPEGYKPGKPRPLVLALHYAGRVTPYYGKGLLTQLIEPGLRDLGAILVAPDCPSRGWANQRSDTEVMALLHHLLENYPIDRRRILVTGYSMGGRGTWYMASRHPDLFTAAMPIAGTPRADELERVGNMPVCVIHSQDDTVVPIGPTEEAVKTLKSRGALVHFVVVNGVTHYDVPSFVQPLKKAVGWIKTIWAE